MGRSRQLKYDLYLDEDVAELPMETRYFFMGLSTIADKEGRLDDRPKKIKVLLFPYDELDIDDMLNQLACNRHYSNGPFIYRYQADDGGKYIQIVNFKKHQNPHPKEKPSEIPPPDEEAVKSNVIKCNLSKLNAITSGSLDLLGPSGSGALSEPEATTPRSPRRGPVYWDPKPTWKPDHPSLETAQLNVEQSHLENLIKDFPDLDISAEIRNMKNHAIENPGWARIKKNWRKTLGGWIRRSDEKLRDARFKAKQARASPTESLVAQEESWRADDDATNKSIAACENEYGLHKDGELIDGSKTRYCKHNCGYYVTKK